MRGVQVNQCHWKLHVNVLFIFTDVIMWTKDTQLERKGLAVWVLEPCGYTQLYMWERHLPGSMAQWVECLTAELGITSSNPRHGQIPFMEINHEIYLFSHSPHSADLRRTVVSYWWNYMHKYWLTAWSIEPAQECESWLTWERHDLNIVDWASQSQVPWEKASLRLCKQQSFLSAYASTVNPCPAE